MCSSDLVPLDASADTKLTPELAQRANAGDSPVAKYLTQFPGDAFPLWDETAAALFLDPTIAKDTTRLAASDPQLWSEVLLLNRDQVLPALRALEEPLGALERALEAGDAAAVRGWLARPSEWRRRAEV